MKGVEWDVETKIEVAIAWLITGSIEKASEMTAIPARTIRDWTKQLWWDDVVDTAKGIKQKELDALWTGLIHKSADALRDRVDNGDSVLDKFGNIKKVPIKGKDLAFITAIAVDKRALARGQATSRTERISIEEKLKKIGDELELRAEKNESTNPTQVH